MGTFYQTPAMQAMLDCLLAGARDGRAGWQAAYARYVSLTLAEYRRACAVFDALEAATSHSASREHATRDGKVSDTPSARTMLTTAYQLGTKCAHTGQFVTLMREYADRLRSMKRHAPASVLGHVAYVALMVAGVEDDASDVANTMSAWEALTLDSVRARVARDQWADLAGSQKPYMTPREHRARRAMHRAMGK